MGPCTWRRAAARALSIAAIIGCATGCATAQAVQGQRLIPALQHGGYVIVFRHSLTDATKPDRASLDLNDCRTQRVLTNNGRILARTIGNVIDRLNIPVDRVYGSPLCRTVWTADLAFGHITIVPGLREPKPKNAANAVKAAAALRPLIAALPASGSNNVIVTHGFNIKSVTGFTPDEGEAAIFRPNDDGAFVLVARVKAAEWEAFSK